MTRILYTLFVVLVGWSLPAWGQKTASSGRDSTRMAAVRNDAATFRPLRDASHTTIVPASVLSRDSLLLIPHMRWNDVSGWIPGTRSATLGMFLQPAQLFYGDGLSGITLLANGRSIADPVTGVSTDLDIGEEAGSRVVLHSPVSGFWYAGSGRGAALDVVDSLVDAPRPVTRIRHVESGYEFLGTDVLFALNPAPSSALQIGLTRHTVGFSNSYNQARFVNERAESWNARAEYGTRISSMLEIQLRARLTDHTQLQYGGIASSRRDGDTFLYPDRSTSFADTAFNPILARTINATGKQVTTQWWGETLARVHWDAQDRQYSEIRVGLRDGTRWISDGLGIPPLDTSGRSPLSRHELWTLPSLTLAHCLQFSDLALFFDGTLSRMSYDDGASGTRISEMRSSLRARIEAHLGLLSIEGLARHDQEGDSQGQGLGGLASLGNPESVQGFAGISWSRRPLTLFERHPSIPSERLRIESGVSQDPPERLEAEAGLRHAGGSGRVELRVFARRLRVPRPFTVGYETGTVPLRPLLILRAQPLVEEQQGGTLSGVFRWWHLQAEGQVTATHSQLEGLSTASRLVPVLSSSLALMARLTLIEGTLELKGGVRHQYESAFTPLGWQSEAGLFLPIALGQASDQALSSYTEGHTVDLFLFATIKRSATIHVHLSNLFDARRITTTFYPMGERSIRFGVDWTLWD